jgi:hypothetical protein
MYVGLIRRGHDIVSRKKYRAHMYVVCMYGPDFLVYFS